MFWKELKRSVGVKVLITTVNWMCAAASLDQPTIEREAEVGSEFRLN